MTACAIVLHDVQVGAGLERRRLARQLVLDRLCADWRETQAEGGTQPGDGHEGDEHRPLHDRLPYAAVTRTASTTLRMYPAGFQRGSIGCVSPPLLVARTFSSWLPAASLIGMVHSRKEYLPRSLPRAACAQVFPPSVETATSLMPWPPSKAMPFSTTCAPALSFAPSATL